ncbi:hypothetical protein [Gilvibacter sp.]|uniref:hypothetical protein n=1 Tax=Gilvibacter sp. TaxID=2729997 RepID=UPI0025C39AC2|nr:hypothetical protein [Gilvibacter sp.]NQX76469.1 hypothetical protein [Gilvibacter sp.]
MCAVHILNGDALLERFPESISGDLLICRECLIDGPLQGRNPETFFANRMAYLDVSYDDPGGEFYLEAVLPQFELMMNIPEQSKVYFWFEADLFCQFNFWFCASLMDTSSGCEYYLVLPPEPHQYGFSGLKNSELESLQQNAIPISALLMASIQELWKAARKADKKKVNTLSTMLSIAVPGLKNLPSFMQQFYEEHYLEVLERLIADPALNDFPSVFRAFMQQEPQYGFGDLLLKRYYDQLTHQS